MKWMDCERRSPCLSSGDAALGWCGVEGITMGTVGKAMSSAGANWADIYGTDQWAFKPVLRVFRDTDPIENTQTLGMPQFSTIFSLENKGSWSGDSH